MENITLSEHWKRIVQEEAVRYCDNFEPWED